MCEIMWKQLCYACEILNIEYLIYLNIYSVVLMIIVEIIFIVIICIWKLTSRTPPSLPQGTQLQRNNISKLAWLAGHLTVYDWLTAFQYFIIFDHIWLAYNLSFFIQGIWRRIVWLEIKCCSLMWLIVLLSYLPLPMHVSKTVALLRLYTYT